jgi:hypothetical protein
MSYIIPNADALVDYLKDFTGSSNDAEIRQCIYLAELALRNIELPALRSDPYDPAYIGIVGQDGMLDIPEDMNKPILFFLQGSTAQQAQSNSSTGPWLVYDRVGDRDIITMQLVSQFYLNPVNVPAVIRGKFSEVGRKYSFVPYLEAGSYINLYYYKAWPLLFAPATELVSATGTVGSIAGAGPWTGDITGMTDTTGLAPGDEIVATDGSLGIGSLGTGTVVINTVSTTSLTFTATGGTTPVAGAVTNVSLVTTIQTNPVLETFTEGYIYGSLTEYYIKRHSPEDAQIYKSKFDLAVSTVEDQNNLGKWSGGNTKITSIFQPRRFRQYNMK